MITDDEDIYRRCFAFHDQGHSPLRPEWRSGNARFIGVDFRFTELAAAVLLAQLRKLPRIVTHLRANKKHYKEMIADLPGMEFREMTDPQGECATTLTVILPSDEIAETIATELGTKVAVDAGGTSTATWSKSWSSGNVTSEKCPLSRPNTDKGGSMGYRKGMLPQTDDLLG